jgi:hypothetical protein
MEKEAIEAWNIWDSKDKPGMLILQASQDASKNYIYFSYTPE